MFMEVFLTWNATNIVQRSPKISFTQCAYLFACYQIYLDTAFLAEF